MSSVVNLPSDWREILVHCDFELARDEIAHFFAIYKSLEPGKETKVEGWAGRADAEDVIEKSRLRFQDQ